MGLNLVHLVHLGNQAASILPEDFMGTPYSVVFIKILANTVGLFLWGLSVWFFLVSVGSLWKYSKPTKKMPFQMTWFSFVFPNTALVRRPFFSLSPIPTHTQKEALIPRANNPWGSRQCTWCAGQCMGF